MRLYGELHELGRAGAVPLKAPSFCKTPSFRGLTAESNKHEKMICYLDPAVKPLDDATICFHITIFLMGQIWVMKGGLSCSIFIMVLSARLIPIPGRLVIEVWVSRVFHMQGYLAYSRQCRRATVFMIL